MTGRPGFRRVARPFAIAIALTVTTLATPVLGLLSAAAWQQHDPASLRMLVHELSVLTQANDGRGVVDNVLATFDPAAGRPG